MNESDEILEFLNKMRLSMEMTKIIARANQLRQYILSGNFDSGVNFAKKINQETDYEGTSVLIHVSNVSLFEFCQATLDALLRLALKKLYDNQLDKYMERNIRINFGDSAVTTYKIYTLLK